MSDVRLTESERDTVCSCPWTGGPILPGDTHESNCSRLRVAVERILAARLADRDAAGLEARVRAWDEGVDAAFRGVIMRQNADDVKRCNPYSSDEEDYGPGCDCTELCSMGPTCPGAILAGLADAGCWRALSPPDEAAAVGTTGDGEGL